MRKICHITTVHPRYDVRIFHKECKSLAKHYDVYLIVADGNGDEEIEGVKIVDIGKRQESRLKRIRIDGKKALNKALELNCEIYHIHDPELLTIVPKLKKNNKAVVYDVHEDLPRQIYGKPYLNKLIKPIISTTVELIENNIASKVDYIITATPFIRDRFKRINKNVIDVNNYPIIRETIQIVNYSSKKKEICYVGGIAEYRGICELVKSIEYTDVILNLAGNFENVELEDKCKRMEGWKSVKFYGFVSHIKVAEILNDSRIGMVTLHPLVNYLDALPVKMYEYMLAGIPVIASNFPLWKKIVEDNKCGICVNPINPQEIAEAINYLINNPQKAEEMGKNGRNAVLSKYNWANEEKKLLETYKQIIV